MDKEKFGARLKLARRSAGMTASEVAERINVSTGEYYTRYERGTITPQLDTIIKLCNLFDITMDYLFAGELQKKSGLENKVPCLSPANRDAVETLVDKMLELEKETN